MSETDLGKMLIFRILIDDVYVFYAEDFYALLKKVSFRREIAPAYIFLFVCMRTLVTCTRTHTQCAMSTKNFVNKFLRIIIGFSFLFLTHSLSFRQKKEAI